MANLISVLGTLCLVWGFLNGFNILLLTVGAGALILGEMKRRNDEERKAAEGVSAPMRYDSKTGHREDLENVSLAQMLGYISRGDGKQNPLSFERKTSLGVTIKVQAAQGGWVVGRVENTSLTNQKLFPKLKDALTRGIDY